MMGGELGGLPSDRCPIFPCSGEPGGMVGVTVAKHYLVSTVHRTVGLVPGAGGRRGDIHVDESDVVVYKNGKSTTTASGRVIAPDGGIACELLEGGVHSEFGLFHTGNQHLVTVMKSPAVLRGSVECHCS